MEQTMTFGQVGNPEKKIWTKKAFNLKKISFFFAPENMKKLLIIGPNFFSSIANRPKIDPTLIFCSIKMAPCATSV